MVHHQRFDSAVLTRIKSLPGLEGLALIQRGSRLSVMPVTAEHWEILLQAAGA